jgi:hypothetical protein
MIQMLRRLCLAACLVCSLSRAEEPSLQQAVLLNRVRTHMQEALQTLPNYTCLETIERVRRQPRSKRFELVDTVRLEVALVNGKELFSWPGERKFDDREISQIVTGGAIGNGNFALHAKSIFMSNSARFDFLGERIREGRKTLRWDYDVPQVQSGYQLRVGPQKAIVGYRGSFWVDPETLDLIRLEVEATDIPPTLNILDTKDSMEYSRVPIGDRMYLLPKSSELRMRSFDDSESVNRTSFTGCRQYTGESTLLFSDASEDSSEPKAAPEVLEIPKGAGFDLALETPIEPGKSAVGDPVSAIVQKDVKVKGKVVLTKGALVHGRITLLRRQQERDRNGWALAMQFFEVEQGNAKGPVDLELERVSMNEIAIPGRDGLQLNGVRLKTAIEPAAGSTMLIRRQSFKMPRGLRMSWRSKDSGVGDKS